VIAASVITPLSRARSQSSMMIASLHDADQQQDAMNAISENSVRWRAVRAGAPTPGGRQRRDARPLGIAIVGGLVVSQVLNLYTTPSCSCTWSGCDSGGSAER